MENAVLAHLDKVKSIVLILNQLEVNSTFE
jgi:hypothetical protein